MYTSTFKYIMIITHIIALKGFNAILNDDVCWTNEHFYAMMFVGQVLNRIIVSKCLLLQTEIFETNTYNVV